MNVITRNNTTTIPSWMTKALVTAVIGVLISGTVAMAFRLSEKTQTHEARISVLEDHQKGIDEKLNGIDRKLDRLIELGRPRYRDGLPTR